MNKCFCMKRCLLIVLIILSKNGHAIAQGDLSKEERYYIWIAKAINENHANNFLAADEYCDSALKFRTNDYGSASVYYPLTMSVPLKKGQPISTSPQIAPDPQPNPTGIDHGKKGNTSG